MKSYEVKLPGGQSESYQYTYTDGYKTITITDSLNRPWTYKKNEKGQVYYEQDPAGNFTNYYYEDAWGNITKKEEHEKLPDATEKVHVTRYKYNSQGKIEEIRELMNEDDPNQEDDEKDLITTFTYDTRGNLTGTIDAEGNTISHEYDGFDRKTLTKRYLKNGEKIETNFTYYDNHLPKTIEDDKGNITEYKYDDQKRLTKVIYPDESYIEVTYTKTTKDEIDYKRVIIKQRNGTTVTNDYDKSSRLVSRNIQPAEGVEGTTFEGFDYDGLNRLTYAENDNFVVEFKFDPLNRVTEEKQMGKLLNYTYNVVNNRRQLAMKYPNDRLIEKNFDILDRLSNIKQGDNEIADYSYIGRSYRLLSKQFGNNDVVNYLYDQGRRMTSKEARNKDSDLINHYKHGYNKVSDLINHYKHGYNKVHMKNYEQRMHENGIGDVFGYDAVYRLTNAKFNVPDPTVENPTDFERERNISLDHVDNITRIDETKNGETSQITTEILPDTDYAKLNQYSRFDQWGLAYDKNGNLTQKATQKMYFDFRNQAVRVTDANTSTENKYDALGRRLQMIVTTGSQSKTENYYYAGHQVIEVRDGSDQVKRQYIYGNGIDEVLRMDAYSGSAITPYYFHSNAIGSTTAVTDANGQVVERYKYSLFGMPTFMDASGNVIPKSTIGNNILFQGREYEPETNFYYYRFRHLDPIMGRFLQTDPMGYQDSLNLYQAFNQNPVNFLDPYGLKHTKEQIDELMRVRRDQGIAEAKNWIDKNTSFTNEDRLALHMKLLVGVYDPEKVEAEKYKTNWWTVMWDTIDGVGYDVAGKTYGKLADAALNHNSGSFLSFMFDLATMGGGGGVLKHYIPIGINFLKGKFPVLDKSVGKLVKKGTEKVKNFFNKIFRKAPKKITGPAQNVNNAVRLRTQLDLEEAGILREGGQGLTDEAISEATEIPIKGGELRNPEVVNELTKIGGNIQDWAKFRTKTITLHSGQRVQVHFYMNRVTGQVSYKPWYDFKVKGKIYLEKGLE
jgi:RHS repeat-associated protein